MIRGRIGNALIVAAFPAGQDESLPKIGVRDTVCPAERPRSRGVDCSRQQGSDVPDGPAFYRDDRCCEASISCPSLRAINRA
jgi:hypothetical protein